MIEPLRLNRVYGPVASIEQPIFCEVCKTKKENRRDPNTALKFCQNCITRRYVCKTCDEEVHRLKPFKNHIRSLLVLGAVVVFWLFYHWADTTSNI